MLQKIHMGEELAKVAAYSVNGLGLVGGRFPATPGGTKNCQMCHGSSDAWQEPNPRVHPRTNHAHPGFHSDVTNRATTVPKAG